MSRLCCSCGERTWCRARLCVCCIPCPAIRRVYRRGSPASSDSVQAGRLHYIFPFTIIQSIEPSDPTICSKGLSPLLHCTAMRSAQNPVLPALERAHLSEQTQVLVTRETISAQANIEPERA